MKKLNLIYVLLIAFCFQACKSEPGDWRTYTFEMPSTGISNNLIMLKVNEADTSFVMHWLFGATQGDISLMGRMSFEDKYTITDGSYALPATNMTFNEVKMNNGNSIKFPLDQDPEFVFDPETEELKMYVSSCSFQEKITQAKVDDVLDQFDACEGEEFSLDVE